MLSALEVWRWRIWSFGSDTGTFAQAVLSAGHGFTDGPEGGSHFLFHFSPILALLTPLVALTHSALTLQLMQVLLVAATAPALYALVLPYAGERLAALIGILTLFYPPLLALAFGEFHEVAFFPVLAIGLIWAADRQRWGWFALFAVACLTTREDVCIELGLVGAGLALWSLLHRPTTAQGLLLGSPQAPRATALAFALLGAGGFATAAAYYHAVFATYGFWPHGHFYDYPFAHGPLAVLAAMVTQPAIALPAVMSVGRFTYLLEAFAPLLLLPLRSRWTLAALPAFAVVLLAREQSVWRMGNHYAAMWAPWVLIAAAAVLIRISAGKGAARARLWNSGAVAACAVVLAAFDPMHPLHYLTPPYADIASARAALACVPHDQPVATHDEWFAEIAADYPSATIQSTGTRYLVYADDFPNDRFRALTAPALASNVRSGRYRIVCSFGSVKTYRRT